MYYVIYTILSLLILNHSTFIYIAPLKSQHIENITVKWKSAGDEYTFINRGGGEIHVPHVIYAPGP